MRYFPIICDNLWFYVCFKIKSVLLNWQISQESLTDSLLVRKEIDRKLSSPDKLHRTCEAGMGEAHVNAKQHHKIWNNSLWRMKWNEIGG